ncbi:hypothetical protein [Anaerobaca lacustris]|uniref:Oligosaccharide repeat unit polymerase n=1 Tax=Anaerobaca lacustris TaxID=3044600 RepID=A0AAW6TWC5_9BACT|nr:hypothetical protein [Sedimentisphaerales bacterium M17dextr]
MIPLTLFILLLCALALCFASNRDIFSPGKFYHMSLTVYFVDIFLSKQNAYIYAIYLGYVLVGMGLSVLEAYTLSRSGAVPPLRKPSGMVPPRFVLVLWALSIIPILAQCYLIHITGGLVALAMTIAHRVGEWRGLGHIVMLVKLIAPINLVYFAVGLAFTKRHAGIWWMVYLLHLLVFAVMALLQGSRGFILLQFVSMAIVYHYLRRPVKLRYALAGGVALLVIAGFLGTVRNNLTRLENLHDLREMQGDTLNLRMLSYGVNPLNVVFEREFTDYQYGKTFLTPVTNFIPRRIWPDKFESGGVVLTKFLRGRHYLGLSHMSTGIVTESILNFGRPLGILWGFLLLTLVIVLLAVLYTKLRTTLDKSGRLSRVWIVLVYAYLAGIGGNLLFGELQAQVGGLFIRLILLSMVMLALRVRILPRWMFARVGPSVHEGRP